MDFELEERYFTWLHGRVVLEFAPSQSRSYYELFKVLHNIEYVWLVLGDDNRAEYGKELRRTFMNVHRQPVPYGWNSEPCSVLEMLIAFASEAEFETDISSPEWFWRFLSTLRLDHLTDAVPQNPDYIETIIDTFIWRKYDYYGNGGLFPLDHPQQDQRNVEIWYQFCAYVHERALI